MSEFGKVLGRRALVFAWLARVVLWSEAIVAAFWPPVILAAFFVALALLGFPQSLNGYLHVIVLLSFAAGLFWLGRDAKRRFRAPAPEAASRRVERDSGLNHRPFSTLLDAPATDAGAAGRALWQMHLDRRRADIKRLQLNLPNANLPIRDPRALRVAVVLLVVLGVAVAGSRSGDRLLDALEPNFSSAARTVPIDAWIKPPPYTGLPPIMLDANSDKPLAVPIGSTIEAHVTEGSRVPRLLIGDERADFRKVDGGGFALTHGLRTPGTLAIKQGWLRSLAKWDITIIPDELPVASFLAPPTATRTFGLKIDYVAQDDYGVASVQLQARIVPSNKKIVAEPIDVFLANNQNEKELKATAQQDLTYHQWAGMKVLAKLVATDGAGQTRAGDEIVVTLPERAFVQPVARSLIAARKQIILSAVPWRNIAKNIASIAYQPDLYDGDTTIFLALRSAVGRLNFGKPEDDQTVLDIEDLLWNSAIKLEDGDKPEADSELKRAEEALAKTLKDSKSTSQDIAKATDDLQKAIDKYLDALSKQQQQGKGEKPPEGAEKVERKDIQEKVDRISQMAQSGARKSAEEMLSNLKQMLDNMQAASSDEGGQQGGQSQEGQQALDELKSLAQQQRDLMNQKGGAQQQSKDQEALRKTLGDAMRDLDKATGQIPKTLSAADRAMKDAAKSLQLGEANQAKQQQGDAAQQLDTAIQGLTGQLSNQGNDGQAFRDGEHGKDPFGRGNPDSQGVKVPTEREMTRAIELLDELRRRAGEQERPRYELDYIQRLLQQF